MKYVEKIVSLFVLTLIVTSALFLSGCAKTQGTHREVVDRLVIRNMTNAPLTDLALRVPEKEVLVAANMILPYREYILGFPPRKNARVHAILSWKHRGKVYKRDLETFIPDDLDKQKFSRFVILVGNDGALHSEIETYRADDELF